MKYFFSVILIFIINSAIAVTWTYQVNVNDSKGGSHPLDSGRTIFAAGPHRCEVTPVSVANNTEYRTLNCGLDTYTVSTSGHCTRKGSKFSSVQYAMLDMSGTKNYVNVVVGCKFD
jgi:hypothetical protein